MSNTELAIGFIVGVGVQRAVNLTGLTSKLIKQMRAKAEKDRLKKAAIIEAARSHPSSLLKSDVNNCYVCVQNRHPCPEHPTNPTDNKNY